MQKDSKTEKANVVAEKVLTPKEKSAWEAVDGLVETAEKTLKTLASLGFDDAEGRMAGAIDKITSAMERRINFVDPSIRAAEQKARIEGQIKRLHERLAKVVDVVQKYGPTAATASARIAVEKKLDAAKSRKNA